MAKPVFNDEATRVLSSAQRRLVTRLAEIEASDRDACAGCGGEDCACCEIYLDRQRWEPLDDVLDRMADQDYYGSYRHVDHELEEEEEEDEEMNERLIKRALRMLRDRAANRDAYEYDERQAYASAADILEYAIDGDEECLNQFDYYGEEATDD